MLTELIITGIIFLGIMIYSIFTMGFAVAGFIALSFILLLFIFLQKGKGSLGLGAMGGATQMIFGGSGGQTFFQKATWIFVTLFMSGSLVLSIQKSKSIRTSKNINKAIPAQPISIPMED